MTDSGGDPAVVGGTDRRWAWIAVLLGAWIVGGVYLVSRALNIGDATDAGLSPYHVVGYGGLLALAAVSIWLVIRARRRGLGWRQALSGRSRVAWRGPARPPRICRRRRRMA